MVDNKKEIRKKILEIRANMDPSIVDSNSNAICEKISGLDAFAQAKDVCLYVPIRNEVNVMKLVSCCLEQGKSVWLPRIIDGQMDFYRYNEEIELVSGAYGISEPDTMEVLMPSGETLVVMPGSVFSCDKGRIGYGGGYYDRYLSDHSYVMTVAACYDVQIVPTLPLESHDIRPDVIVSEKRVID